MFNVQAAGARFGWSPLFCFRPLNAEQDPSESCDGGSIRDKTVSPGQATMTLREERRRGQPSDVPLFTLKWRPAIGMECRSVWLLWRGFGMLTHLLIIFANGGTETHFTLHTFSQPH